MHVIDTIFRPTDNESCKEPISTSKLDKEDAVWQDQKWCLGWDYAAKSKHLMVANHQYDKIMETLSTTLLQKRSGLKPWQTLIRQLCSLVPGVPGSKGQFSLLQGVLTARKPGLKLN